MNEWQRVRLAPLGGKAHVVKDAPNQLKVLSCKTVGQIVRVRKAEADRPQDYNCGAEYFVEIHPEDFERLVGHPAPPRLPIMCEHQIQAD